MKRVFSIGIIFFISFSAFAQNQKPANIATSVVSTPAAKNVQTISATGNQTVNINTVDKNKPAAASNKNDTSIVKDAVDATLSYYRVKNSSGTILTQGKLMRGMKEGLWRFHYDFGTPFKMEEYHLGKKNGAAVTYDRSGFIQYDETYKNDELDGISLHYINGGKVKSQIEYKKGKLDGRKLLNYDDGGVQEESYWKNGAKTGSTKWFYQKNVLMMESEYKDGKLNGVTNTYNEKGKLVKTGKYVNDLEDGEWKEFDEAGNTINLTVYKNGVVEMGKIDSQKMFEQQK